MSHIITAITTTKKIDGTIKKKYFYIYLYKTR